VGPRVGLDGCGKFALTENPHSVNKIRPYVCFRINFAIFISKYWHSVNKQKILHIQTGPGVA
jgi:hypothetical protein